MVAPVVVAFTLTKTVKHLNHKISGGVKMATASGRCAKGIKFSSHSHKCRTLVAVHSKENLVVAVTPLGG